MNERITIEEEYYEGIFKGDIFRMAIDMLSYGDRNNWRLNDFVLSGSEICEYLMGMPERNQEPYYIGIRENGVEVGTRDVIRERYELLSEPIIEFEIMPSQISRVQFDVIVRFFKYDEE